MGNLNFKYCPICSGDLEIGKARFPNSIGRYYSDKITEELDGHSFKKLLRKPDKVFIKDWGAGNPVGYCEKCGKIFAEFDVRGEYNLIGEETIDYYEDKIVSYDDDSDEKYDTIDGYTILTDSIKLKKSED